MRTYQPDIKYQPVRSTSPINSNMSAGIRSVVLLLSIISLILILTAPGACFTRYQIGKMPTETCPGQCSILAMNSDQWSSGQHFKGRGENIYGQVPILIISLVLALGALGFSFIPLVINTAMVTPQVVVSAVCLIAFIVLGGVETWYAAGFDHMAFFVHAMGNDVVSSCAGQPDCQIVFVVKGWAVAAAFYFLSAVLFLIDIGVVLSSSERRDSDNYGFARPYTSV